MTRLTFSCGTKQSKTEFAAQRGPQQEFWLSFLNRIFILLMHEPLELFCQDDDYRRDIIILAQLRWDFPHSLAWDATVSHVRIFLSGTLRLQRMRSDSDFLLAAGRRHLGIRRKRPAYQIPIIQIILLYKDLEVRCSTFLSPSVSQLHSLVVNDGRKCTSKARG